MISRQTPGVSQLPLQNSVLPFRVILWIDSWSCGRRSTKSHSRLRKIGRMASVLRPLLDDLMTEVNADPKALKFVAQGSRTETSATAEPAAEHSVESRQYSRNPSRSRVRPV